MDMGDDPNNTNAGYRERTVNSGTTNITARRTSMELEWYRMATSTFSTSNTDKSTL
jgi:hypothetical protein